jgi:hypothetical protein
MKVCLPIYGWGLKQACARYYVTTTLAHFMIVSSKSGDKDYFTEHLRAETGLTQVTTPR